LRILGLAAQGLFVMAQDTMAPRRGGAVSGGMRGAVVGGMAGGSEGAATGAKVGAVTAAARAAIDRETQARTQYQATGEYQNAQRSNFNEVPPDVFDTTPAGTATKPGGEVVIRRNDKPVVEITFPVSNPWSGARSSPHVTRWATRLCSSRRATSTETTA
jgi:hypothetical protein